MVAIALTKLVFRMVGPKEVWYTGLFIVPMVNVPNIDILEYS